MTIVHEESVEPRDVSRSLSSMSIEINFIVRGDTGDIADESDVVTYLLANANKVESGIPFNEITNVEFINANFYRASVLYQSVEDLSEDPEIETGATYTFDTTGGTTHIDTGIELIGKAGERASDIIGAGINWDGERMNGVDITTPAFKWTKAIRIPKSQYTDEFVQKIYKATGKVNDGPFLFFGPRDAKYDGATATFIETFDGIEDEVEIVHHVSATEIKFFDSEDERIDGEILPAKPGWDYAWFQYEKTVDDNKKVLIPKKIAGYVVRVYEETNFEELGISE